MMNTERHAASPWQRWRLFFGIWLAARMLPFRIRGKSFAQILAAADNGTANDYPQFPLAVITRYVRKAVRNPVLMRDRRCLRAGLVGYEYLRRSGYQPELHFAVDEATLDSNRLSAHCWVSVAGEEVVNRHKDGQVTIYVHRAAAPGLQGKAV